MKRLVVFILVATGIICGLSDVMAVKSIRIAVITGGHSFDRHAFFGMFGAMESVEWTEFQHPDANDLYGSDSLEYYDVLVFYDMVQDISPQQKSDFMECLEKGVGMVFLHHALVSYQHWDAFHEVVGGKYVLADMMDEADSSSASNYKHDESIRVLIADRDHPVTAGLQDFEILDEVYINYRVGDHVAPLLKTSHPLSPPLIGWTNVHGRSRIVYLQSGHDRHAFDNTHYRQLVQQAIEWTAAR